MPAGSVTWRWRTAGSAVYCRRRGRLKLAKGAFEQDLTLSRLAERHCQINLWRANRVGSRMHDHLAATASRHWFAALVRKIRSVERETRWR